MEMSQGPAASVNKRTVLTVYLQKVPDDLVWDNIAHIVGVGQLREGHSSHFGTL